jgi:hypothetical protein
VLSVFGNIVVSWSWFGVNQLGVGLHSYGFTSGVAISLVSFAFTQVLVIGAALFVPMEHWKSAPKPGGAPAEGGGDHA